MNTKANSEIGNPPVACTGDVSGIDNFGNACRIIEEVTIDGARVAQKVINNAFYNDAGNWILGRLTRSAVTATAFAGANGAGYTATRTARFNYLGVPGAGTDCIAAS